MSINQFLKKPLNELEFKFMASKIIHHGDHIKYIFEGDGYEIGWDYVLANNIPVKTIQIKENGNIWFQTSQPFLPEMWIYIKKEKNHDG